MKVEKFKDVTIFYISKKIIISIFKKGKRKIEKSEYSKFCYNWAINFGLFYIAFSKNEFIKGWSFDISSKLGNVRIIRQAEVR